jgi:hypothetical protein
MRVRSDKRRDMNILVATALAKVPSAECCFGLARRIVRTSFSAGTRAGGAEEFWLIFSLRAVTLSQKFSVTQITNLVPQVLMLDMAKCAICPIMSRDATCFPPSNGAGKGPAQGSGIGFGIGAQPEACAPPLARKTAPAET